MDLTDVRAILERHHHCVIASASLEGAPWVSPLFFNYTEDLRIVFESAHNSRHAQLIAENTRVAIVVADLEFQGAPRGVYFECSAREVAPGHLEAVLEVFLNGPHQKTLERSTVDYLGDKPLRLYEARPERLFYLTQVTQDGFVIDERVEIPLPWR